MTLTQIFDFKNLNYTLVHHITIEYRGEYIFGIIRKNTLYFYGGVYIKIHIEESKKTPPKFPFEKGEVRWSFLLYKQSSDCCR